MRYKINDWETNCNDYRVKHSESNGWATVTEINKVCLKNKNKNGMNSLWMMQRGETKISKAISIKMTWKKTRNDKFEKKATEEFQNILQRLTIELKVHLKARHQPKLLLPYRSRKDEWLSWPAKAWMNYSLKLFTRRSSTPARIRSWEPYLWQRTRLPLGHCACHYRASQPVLPDAITPFLFQLHQRP